MLLHDYEPYPASESGGVWMRGEPVLAKDLVWAGFDRSKRARSSGYRALSEIIFRRRFIQDSPEHSKFLDRSGEGIKINRLDHIRIRSQLVAAKEIRLLFGRCQYDDRNSF